ncbi:MAG: FHA domain-containing protein [Planctomycetota bacterium]
MIPFVELQRVATELGEAPFLVRYPDPALLVYDPAKAHAGDHDTHRTEAGTQAFSRSRASDWLSKTEGSDWLSKTYEDMSVLDPQPDLPLDVCFVRKSPGSSNPFPNLISLGRMRSNDVVLSTTVVSKVHAAILVDPPGRDGRRTYQLRDQNSTNGTFVEGVRLAADQRHPLRDGVGIGFGGLRLRFVHAPTLYRALRDPGLLDQLG